MSPVQSTSVGVQPRSQIPSGWQMQSGSRAGHPTVSHTPSAVHGIPAQSGSGGEHPPTHIPSALHEDGPSESMNGWMNESMYASTRVSTPKNMQSSSPHEVT